MTQLGVARRDKAGHKGLVKSQMIHYCHRMDRLGWVANHDGNLSCRFGASSLLATPTARAKSDLESRDLIELNPTGKVISGKGKPFSELAVHLRIYEKRADAQAVVHAHPPNAMAVGLAQQEMRTAAVPEAVVSLGPCVPTVGLSLPNSSEFFQELDQLLPHYDAVMVAGNGVFSWGNDLEQAFLRMELVEHLAKIFLAALPLGGMSALQELNSDQVAELLRKREKAGLARPADPRRPV